MMNEDYIKGMKILLKYSYERRFNVRKYTWIPLFSKYLSNEGLCEKFWTNVQKQDVIGRIVELKFYHPYRHKWSLGELIDYLLVWSRTTEGENFWHKVFVDYINQPRLII